MTRFTSLLLLSQILLLALCGQEAYGQGTGDWSAHGRNDPANWHKPTQKTRPCVRLTIPVPITAENFQFARSEEVKNNIDAIEFNLRTDSVDFKNPVQGKVNVSGTYDINAMLCDSRRTPKGDTLLIATHGVSFDASYWDSAYRPDEYSFVDYALKKDYAILTYDRLGSGRSQKPHGLDVVQSAAHVEVLKYITDLARSGELLAKSKHLYWGERLPGGNHYKAQKVIHVGHSYGSAIMLMALAKYPDMADGVVLTGYMPAKQPYAPKMGLFNFQHAAQADPLQFRDRPHSYLTIGSKSGYHYLFVASETLDKDAFDYYWNHRQTGTVGEILSSIGFIMSGKGDVSQVKSPVLIATGQKDRAFCPGNTCETQLDMGFLRAMFNGSSKVDAYLQPKTGHLLTSALNASVGYTEIFRWLNATGL